MSTVNPQAITRTEFDAMVERMASRLAALELNESPSPTLIDQEGRALSGQSEAVTQNEFRLFKWLATFVVAAVLGAFGVIYQQIAGVRVEMRDLHNTVLRELYTQLDTQIGGLRKEMKAEIGGLRQDIGSLRERVVRVETLLVGEKSRTER
ncbi:MAG: hypothetical protein F4Y41_11885 [Gammaproteobacteria bacterium]|nr:hypothetical protein [Gammaproteobacteria bacterium]